jgi:hypothetical protein
MVALTHSQKHIETAAAAPSCATCGGEGCLVSYLIVVYHADGIDRDETKISRWEFDRRMAADLTVAPGLRASHLVKRVRACPKCRPAVNRERRNYGS